MNLIRLVLALFLSSNLISSCGHRERPQNTVDSLIESNDEIKGPAKSVKKKNQDSNFSCPQCSIWITDQSYNGINVKLYTLESADNKVEWQASEVRPLASADNQVTSDPSANPLWSLKLVTLDRSMDWSTQKKLHQLLLQRIFNEWSKDKLTSLSTGPLESIDHEKRLAKACDKSNDWREYALHYPRHKIKKSSNQIFVESIRDVKELKDLFRIFELKIQLQGVEKVFATKDAKKLGLRKRKKYNICYDAGSYWFDIKNTP